MKTFSCLLGLLLAALQPISGQGDVVGTWQLDAPAPERPWSLVLRRTGSRLTGMVSSCFSPGPVDISDASVSGNAIAFKCKSLPSNDRTITFRGTLRENEIDLAWSVQLGHDRIVIGTPTGPAPASRFVVRRVPDGELAAIADQVRGITFAAAVNDIEKDVRVEGTLFVPDGAEPLRAVIVVTYWGLGQAFYNDLATRRLAEATRSGLLLVSFSNMGPSTQLFRNLFNVDGAAALVRLLQRFGEESRRAEIAHLPFVFWGHSAGGGRVFAQALSNRTVAFVLYHSAGGGVSNPNLPTQIPALVIKGGKDETNGRPNDPEEFWRLGRSAGVPWTFGLEPDATHASQEHLSQANSLVAAWITAVLERRLSRGGAPLRLLDTKSGWLGNIRTAEVVPVTAYKGRELDASWLPDEPSARHWQILMGSR
jgi:dienelactone hydrolase